MKKLGSAILMHLLPLAGTLTYGPDLLTSVGTAPDRLRLLWYSLIAFTVFGLLFGHIYCNNWQEGLAMTGLVTAQVACLVWLLDFAASDVMLLVVAGTLPGGAASAAWRVIAKQPHNSHAS